MMGQTFKSDKNVCILYAGVLAIHWHGVFSYCFFLLNATSKLSVVLYTVYHISICWIK